MEEAELDSLIRNAPRPYVLVNFFATWCKPCRTELPELVALQNDPNSKVEVILISLDKPADAERKLHSFLSDQGINFKTYAVTEDQGAFVAQFYTIWDSHIPLSLIYSKSGKMVEAITGVTDRAEIELIVNMNEKLGS